MFVNPDNMYTFAAKLPVLLSVHFFLGYSLLFRLFDVSFVHKISHR